ncbi:PAS domain S-box protein [Halapricum salinum]|uniref:histidine kinase n=1 Tax=Halapricum salinum TaxID=1457250 RepID=A0A4D6HFA7_9EURY|nr:PAS domain S-box protein [Halapricum salinum]QCC51848.1 hybrid sensor histidine kinase/response regulator [Halapricum salinum]
MSDASTEPKPSSEHVFLWVESELRSLDRPLASTRQVPAIESGATVSVPGALERLRRGADVSAIVCEQPLPNADAVAFLEAVRVQEPAVPVFLVTGDHDETTANRARQAGVTEYLVEADHEGWWNEVIELLEMADQYHRRSRTVGAAGPSLEAVLETAPDGLGIVRDGRFVDWNGQLCDLLGVADCTLSDVEPDDIVDPKLLSVGAEGDTYRHESGVPITRPSCGSLVAEVTTASIQWDGAPATLLICRDRSPAAADPTLSSGKRLQQAIEDAGHAVYMTAPDGTIRYVNAAFETITGYAAREALGQTPQLLNSGLTPSSYYEGLWETITAGDVWQETVTNRRKNGEIYHADQTIAPVTADGTVHGFIAIQSDVTAKKEMEDDLRTFKSIVERIDDPIMIQDSAGRFQVVNDAVSELAGLSRGELIGTDEFAFMDDATAEQIQTMKSRVLERGDPVTYEVSPELPGNGERRFSTVRYPQYDDDGTPAGTLAICRDVTDIKKHQRQFRVIERVLRHNLRNHFQVIRGVAESIEAEGSGRVAENAQTVVRTTDAVLETVDKERQITEFLSEPEPAGTVDLAQVAVSVAEQARRNHEDAAVAVDSPGQCNAVAVNLIDRAVEELVENAIVHSDGDSPTVTVTVTCDGDWAQVAVADDGPGIPAMERDVLTGRREIGPLNHGQGIGMWIVHLIVQESDGRLEFTENEPRGSVVTVAVPRPDRT